MGKKTILIVDDKEEILEVLEEILISEGYDILRARNGKECLSKLNKKPDLVLLDFFMPDMSGEEVIRRIRKSHKLRDTKIAMLTIASFSQAGEKKLENLGVVDYIKKPFKREDLVKRIKVILK